MTRWVQWSMVALGVGTAGCGERSLRAILESPPESRQECFVAGGILAPKQDGAIECGLGRVLVAEFPAVDLGGGEEGCCVLGISTARECRAEGGIVRAGTGGGDDCVLDEVFAGYVDEPVGIEPPSCCLP